MNCRPELARLAASSASPSRVLNHSGAEQTSWEQLSPSLCGLSYSYSIVCSMFSKHHHQSMTGSILELASLPSAGWDENQLRGGSAGSQLGEEMLTNELWWQMSRPRRKQQQQHMPASSERNLQVPQISFLVLLSVWMG